MSTPNFYNGNASRIYAFGMNKYVKQSDLDDNELEDIEVGDFSEDLTRWSYEDSICNVIHELESNVSFYYME